MKDLEIIDHLINQAQGWPLYYIDFYKVGHVLQYPKDTTGIWSNWTARSTRVMGRKEVVNFGGQNFIKEVLIKEWQKEFFDRPWSAIEREYRTIIHATLGTKNVYVDHIKKLHETGYLPIAIYNIPEGYSIPLNVPSTVITNTLEHAFWLPNYLETIWSAMTWKASTSATMAREYRKLFIKYAKEAGETDLSFVDFQGHDFSERGETGRDDIMLSGMGHLLSFRGTDSLPAILQAAKIYGAPLNCGTSIPATEHSVMCASFKDDELETFRRLITEVYPSGPVSIVSDTWDLWKVLTEYVPKLKSTILSRDGNTVIRPDSGDPVKITCGDSEKPIDHPAYKGVLRLLAETLGTSPRPHGLPLINKAAEIYGDSITIERADAILDRVIHELKLSPFNMVFGIGSFTYQYVTRDTNGYAMKATAVRRKDQIYEIFKKPVTDDGGKISHKGIVAVYRTQNSTDKNPVFYAVQGATLDQLNNCAFDLVYKDGKLLKDYKWSEITERVRA